MGDIIDIIKGRPDGDALMTFLCNEIAEVQILAMALQDNGIGYGDVVVPMKFAHLVKDGEVKVLGRAVIAGNVSRVGLVACPID